MMVQPYMYGAPLPFESEMKKPQAKEESELEYDDE
jgi:hypothetical protein